MSLSFKASFQELCRFFFIPFGLDLVCPAIPPTSLTVSLSRSRSRGHFFVLGVFKEIFVNTVLILTGKNQPKAELLLPVAFSPLSRHFPPQPRRFCISIPSWLLPSSLSSSSSHAHMDAAVLSFSTFYRLLPYFGQNSTKDGHCCLFLHRPQKTSSQCPLKLLFTCS